MRKLQFILGLILISALTSFGQFSGITVSGQVSDLNASVPVPNHPVTINAVGDSLTGSTFYFSQTVMTDASGNYSVTIQNAPTPIFVYVSTVDCQGQYQYQSLFQAPFVANFSICTGVASCDADFYYYPDSMATGMIQFIDVSTGNPSTWLWNFGDGSTSTLQNPSHTYAQPGSYVVTLIINGTNCTDADSALVIVGAQPCMADFTYSSTPMFNLMYQFTDLSTGNPTSWTWDFGDGSTSTDQNPIHTYAQSGSYVVTLTISGSGCSSTISMFIQVGAQPCFADFWYYPDSNSVSTVNFFDLSVGNPNSWFWSFGDGTSSTLQNPTHTYAQPGTYNVTLAISGANCSDSISYMVYIGMQPCFAMFDFLIDSVSSNTYHFYDYSTGNPTSWVWDFGDGTTSSLQNPTHTYASNGVYVVTLTIAGPNCSATNMMTIQVGPVPCDADFIFYPDSNSVTSFIFYDLSLGNPTSWYWDFGDGSSSTLQHPAHNYASQGTYDVTLIIMTPTCTDSVTMSVYVGSQPCAADFAYTTTPMLQYTYSFIDLSTGSPTSWLWNFGDGNTSTDQNPTHTYAQAGTYVVSLMIFGPGCQSYAQQTIVVGNLPCAADFYAYPDSFNTLLYQFIDVSTGNPTNWYWDFGDGNSSTMQHPSHNYAQQGNYTVTLMISGSNCSDTVSQIISVGNNTLLVSEFTYVIDSVNPLSVQFTDISSGNPISWYWSFGDGNFSMDQHPFHTYATAGTYMVTLLVTGTGATSTSTQDVLVGSGTTIVAQFSYIITRTTGSTYAFTDESTGMPDSWNWDFGDGNTSADQHPVHTFAAPGTYSVSLTASNESNSDTYTEDIVVDFNDIAEESTSSFFKVVPNPNNGLFELQFNDLDNEAMQLSIHNVQGQLIRTFTVDAGNGSSTIDLTSYAKGLYIVHLTGTNSHYQQKVVVE